MIRRPPRSTRTDTLLPYTTLFRSQVALAFVSAGEAFGDNERALRPVVVAGAHLKIPADKRGSVDFTFGGHDRFIEIAPSAGGKADQINCEGARRDLLDEEAERALPVALGLMGVGKGNDPDCKS